MGCYTTCGGEKMLLRKVETDIKKWIRNPKSALLVTGARQVGKTFAIRKCLKEMNCDYVEINLIKNPELIGVLSHSTSTEDLKLNLSLATGHTLIKNKTYIFIDEIQQYKQVVTKIKFWVDEAEFYFCMSGSLLGVELTGLESAPVGYLEEIHMFPLDFEEFLIASGINAEITDELRNCFLKRIPVSPYINEKILEIFRRYIVVGGMPAAVDAYISNGDMNEVMSIQSNIISQYKLDFTKYEQENKRLMLISIYNGIPSQLMKQNHRYNYSDIEKGLRYEKAESSFLWLTNAGVAIPVYNTTVPKVALEQNKKSNLIKLYVSDVGLLTCMYGAGAKLKILMNDNSMNCGGIYENTVAQELTAHGFDAYFYNSHKQGELDFVIENNGAALPIEIKSGKDYYIHSAINNVIGNAEYDIKEAFIFANCNVEVKDKITYFPIYMVMFIKNTVELPVLKPISF